MTGIAWFMCALVSVWTFYVSWRSLKRPIELRWFVVLVAASAGIILFSVLSEKGSLSEIVTLRIDHRIRFYLALNYGLVAGYLPCFVREVFSRKGTEGRS